MSPPKTTPIRWPAFIITLVAAFAGFSWWSLQQAASNVSAVSDPGYYAHGLKYRSASLDAQTASTTGWTVTPRLSGRSLMVEVHDAGQRSLAGCQAIISLPPGPREQRTPATVTLSDLGDGIYSGTLPAGLAPSVSATLTLTKNQATTRRQILINQDS